ncbi:hypothetical protein [Leptotrichia sp. oral taxon 847]|uniref:hypothetical protein n=1 Tax=Leptotrichia sp. oral taxon 847 TaxID=1785996 RepID=UPI000767E667|nr:hypothetical protein [Leptotrichia sp. oral taxon 847]AMD94238.1 hypothetical protein AXF11_00595 [Leptotrichia sp. oral taxon 847]
MKTKKIEEKIIKKFRENPSEIKKLLNLFRNLVGILISFRFITLNLDFYNTVFKEFPNDKIHYITSHLVMVSFLFWIFLFWTIFSFYKKGNRENLGFNIMFLIFIVVSMLVDISRVYLESSPYFNDLVTSSQGLTTRIGLVRVAYIFFSISLFFCMCNTKNFFLIVISVLTFSNAVMIWLDFDADITAILRIIIGIMCILFYGYEIIISNFMSRVITNNNIQ